MKFIHRSALVLIGLSVALGGARAGILDQSFEPDVAGGNYNPLIVSATQTLTQTFTVGLDGLLSRVEVFVATGGDPSVSDLVLDVLTTLPDGSPSGVVLASHSFAAADVTTAYSFIGFDLGASTFGVTTGELLAIRLTTAAPGRGGLDPYAWGAEVNGAYAGGGGFISHPDGQGEVSIPFTFGFRTYVQAVPEPASIATFGIGAIGVLGVARRRKA